MKAAELREKTVDELLALERQFTRELFDARIKNLTNQLDDTSSLPKRRRTIATLKGELRRRELMSLQTRAESPAESPEGQ